MSHSHARAIADLDPRDVKALLDARGAFCWSTAVAADAMELGVSHDPEAGADT